MNRQLAAVLRVVMASTVVTAYGAAGVEHEPSVGSEAHAAETAESRDGCAWQPGFGVADLDGGAFATTVFDDGPGPALYVGGSFSTAGGTPVNGIARWDGSAWTGLAGGVNGGVQALAVLDDGSGPALYAGGVFSTAGGESADNIARWNGSTWSALDRGVSGRVRALAVFDDGSGPALYAGGDFIAAGSDFVHNIARWDGTAWSPLTGPSGFGTNGYVYALAVFDDGSGPALYAGGGFTTAGGVTVNHVARWDGSGWSPLTGPSGTGTSGPVEALAILDDGSGPALYAGGGFATAGGATVNNVARWDGSGWSPLTGPAGTGTNGEVYALATFDDGSGPALFAGGQFLAAGGLTVNRVARWDGSSWSPLTGPAGTGTDFSVDALAVFDDGSGPALYTCGWFTAAGGLWANSIARWDGSAWSAMGGPVGMGTNNEVYAVAAVDDGSGPALYAGGWFTMAGGVTVNHVARWDGSRWAPLAGPAGTGADGTVSAFAGFDDGSGPALYAGGWFTTAGGVTVNNVARWDGSAWTGLAGTLNNGVDALAIFDDGSGLALYAGGWFTTAGGVTVNHVARWDGSGWSPLTGPAGTGTNGDVSALAVFDDGSGPALYAGGWFTTAGGVTVNNVARWDGSGWSPLTGPAGTGANGNVEALEVFDDGSGPALYAGGGFATAGGATVNNVARWDGSAWSPLAEPAGTGTLGAVLALAVLDDGSGPALYAGGVFVGAGSVPVNNVARWDGSTWSGLSGPLATGIGGTDAAAISLAAFDDGAGPALFVGGVLTTAGGLPSLNIAAWRCPTDAIPPSDPVILDSTTHDPGVWSSDTVIQVEWSGAADSGGSGLAGYSVLFDTSPLTLPDTTLEVLHDADPHLTASGVRSDGQAHWFHVRTCDHALNCSGGVRLGPFWVDAMPPGTVSNLASPSHPPGEPTADATVDLTWTAASDAGSGVAGYAYELSPDPSWSCDQQLDTASTSATSTPLADGAWYAHVCAVDLLDHWGGVASAGPFVVDLSPPVVTTVQSVADTGDGRLEDLEGTQASITQLYVGFAEAVSDPTGDLEPDDVTNPANYLLVESGVDGCLATESCAEGLIGDDQQVTVDRVLYDAAATTARLKLAGGAQLARGWYRLLVCGSTSILDLAGNPLDGDGDGQGGDDLLLDFAVSDTNLLVNPNFDESLAGWEVSSPGYAAFSPDDVDLAPTSGSTAVATIASPPEVVAISQCVPVRAGQGHAVGGRARIASSLGEDPHATAVVELYGAPACEGAPLASRSVPGLKGDTGAAWPRFWSWVPASPGQQSATVRFVLEAGDPPHFGANLDNLLFMEMLFGGGFEQGDLSAWSSAAP